MRDSRHWPGFAVVTVLVLSVLLFAGTHLAGSNHQSLAVWVLGSWPTLLALAIGLFLLEAGPLRSWPALLRKVATLVRYVLCFLAFWAVLPLLGLPKNVMTPLALLGTGAFFFLMLFRLGTAFRIPRLLARVSGEKSHT